MNTIASLLAVQPSELIDALCSRVIATRSDVVQKRHSAEQAYYGRDAFAKVRTPDAFSIGKYSNIVHLTFW